MLRLFVSSAVVLALATPAAAQLGSLGRITDAVKKADKVFDDLTITEDEEAQLGSEISVLLRLQYGVVQDKAVHQYVTLTGTLLARASERPGLKWTFVVLDTDGVNAFAAPGGFIHITRGALALIQNEAELADVLGHEIGHVAGKHTVNAIRKGTAADAGAKAGGKVAGSRKEFIEQLVGQVYEKLVENRWDRGEEMDADRRGVTLAAKVGYAPNGMSAFLSRLSDRYKDVKERSGIFASHPDITARIDSIGKVISAGKLTASATVAARYKGAISYTLVPLAALATVAPGEKPAASGGGTLGLGGSSALGREKSGSQAVSSAGSRGFNTDRYAKGGPSKGLVVVAVTPAELDAFRKGISG